MSQIGKMFACLLIGAALALLPPVAEAAVKKRVEVVFIMPDKKYVRAFRPERIDALLAGAAAAIAEELARAIRFLEFTTTGPAAYQLVFRLDRADPQVTGTDDEFGFHVTLTGEGIRKAQQTYWRFRSAERYGDRIGTHEELVKEIRLNVAHESNVAQLVGEVLHEAAFTEEADFRTEEPVGWVLKHYSRDDLCLDVDSRLEVRSRYRVGSGKKSTDFRAIVVDWEPDEGPGGVLTEPEEEDGRQARQFEKLLSSPPEDIEVERVYVVEYVRFCPAVEADSPASVNFQE